MVRGIDSLTELLDQDQQALSFLPDTVKRDMQEFIERMISEDVDLKQLGIRDKTKQMILEQLRVIYG